MVKRRALLVVALTASCVRSDLATCGSELICPEGSVCTPAGDRCVLSAQIDACRGNAERAACSYLGALGTCAGGLCITADEGRFTVSVSLPGNGGGRVVSCGSSRRSRSARR